MRRSVFASITVGLGASLLLASSAALADEGHATMPAAEVSRTGDSLYLLGGSFTDQEGKQLVLAQLAGKPVLISMFYASCPHACPMLISDIKRVEKALDPEVRKDLRVVLVTFDPERDTTEALRKLRNAHGVDTARWSFLRTDPDKVRELAAVLGIRYRFASDGSIGHSSVITLLDKKGAIAGRLEGARQPNEELVKKVIAAAK